MTGPFEGYRVWRIAHPRDGLLKAAIADFVWEGPVLTVPETDWSGMAEGGGFHSHRTREGNLDYVRHVLLPNYNNAPYYYPSQYVTAPQNVILGTVRHFGMVVEYEKGFRSSQVLVTSLEVPDVWDADFCALLASRYQCEVVQYTEVPAASQQEVESSPRYSISPMASAIDQAQKQMAAHLDAQMRALMAPHPKITLRGFLGGKKK